LQLPFLIPYGASCFGADANSHNWFIQVCFFKKKLARGLFAAVEDLFISKIFGDIKGTRDFPKRA
jgi:hypothetical protein